MTALPADLKCSHTNVYAPLSNQLAPCPRTRSKALKPLSIISKRISQMKKLRLRSAQWIVDEHNNIIIGKGRADILENIEKTGSINQAAKVMKMSYKAVWSKIKRCCKITNGLKISACPPMIRYSVIFLIEKSLPHTNPPGRTGKK
jgi:hypothetical protein